jgi:hypothetical protein
LRLSHDKLVSKFAFKWVNVRRYNPVEFLAAYLLKNNPQGPSDQ